MRLQEDSTISSPRSQKNPYLDSCIVHKLISNYVKGKPLRIAFLDVDATMTGPEEKTNEARLLLEKLGFAIVYVTARTEEMLLSERQYKLSVGLGFTRPHPRMHLKDGKRHYRPPEDHEPSGIIDPDCVAGSSGTQIILRQTNGGFLEDKEYTGSFQEDSSTWREKVYRVLTHIAGEETLWRFDTVDNPENYYNRKSSVFPPYFRITLEFDSLKKEKYFLQKIKEIKKNKDSLIYTDLSNIRITDDSYPANNYFSLHLTPRNGSKALAVDRIISGVCSILEVKRSDVTLLIAGDSFPDLEMGILGGKGANVTFLLSGGSRLTRAITTEDTQEFATEELIELKKHIAHLQKVHKLTTEIITPRTVIIGDQQFEGVREVETILSYLAQQYPKKSI